MRIGMMADAYKPHVSGVTNVISLSKRFLEKAGYEVYVFTFGGGDYQDDEPNVVRTRGMKLVDTGLYFSARHSSDALKILRKMDRTMGYYFYSLSFWTFLNSISPPIELMVTSRRPFSGSPVILTITSPPIVVAFTQPFISSISISPPIVFALTNTPALLT